MKPLPGDTNVNLIIDANILFSALIRNGFTTDILLNTELDIYAPEFILEELNKYKGIIIKKSGVGKIKVEKILNIILNQIKIISKEEFLHLFKEAYRISPDKKDAHYFALALKLNCPIWSNDKKLKDQKEIEVYSTEEIIELL